MTSKHTFYQNLLTIEILSEEPLRGDESLFDIEYLITKGPCSGKIEFIRKNEPVDGRRMAQLLQDQGSEPGFFGLDEEGLTVDDNEREDAEKDDTPPTIQRTLFIEKTIRYATTYQARDEEEAESIENQIEGSTDFSKYQILGTNRWTEEEQSLFSHGNKRREGANR